MIRAAEQLSFAEEMQHAAQNMAVGLLVVFAILFLLMLVIFLFRFLPHPKTQDPGKNAADTTPAKGADIAATGDAAAEEEIAVAIAAAIAAATASAETPGTNYVVRRVRRAGTNTRALRVRS